MEFELFLGVLAAVLLGNGLTAVYLYALFWGDAQKRRGVPEERFPRWWFAGAGIPPVIGAVAAYVALY